METFLPSRFGAAVPVPLRDRLPRMKRCRGLSPSRRRRVRHSSTQGCAGAVGCLTCSQEQWSLSYAILRFLLENKMVPTSTDWGIARCSAVQKPSSSLLRVNLSGSPKSKQHRN